MMKKLISLALTLAMLCCMATTAFAVKESVVGAVTTDNVLTPQTHDPGSLENGVEDFDADGPEYQVNINVSTNQTEHRYAVDIEYDTAALNIGGSELTWNVNTMKYDVTTAADSDANGPWEKTVTIYNYSDRPIVAAAEVEKVDAFTDAPVTLAVNPPLQTIAKATPGAGDEDGTAATGTVIITVTPDDKWSDLSAYLADKGESGDAITIATASLTIAKAP